MEHILQYNHNFNWKNVRIIDIESNYNKRLISETLHIKEQLNGINFKKDTESLDDIYVYLLNLIANNNKNDSLVLLTYIWYHLCLYSLIVKIGLASMNITNSKFYITILIDCC